MSRLAWPVVTAALALSLAGCYGAKEKPDAYLARAKAFAASGDDAKAEIEFTKALKLAPADAEINLALAKLEDRRGDLNSAVPHYVRAAIPEAHLLEPQVRLAEILIESNRYQDATARINLANVAFPDNPEVLALRSDIAERQNQVAAAKADAAKALQKDPANARAMAVSARLALRAGDADAALDWARRGLAQHPDDLPLLQVAASTLIDLNQTDKAAETFQTIARLAPTNVVAQSNAAGILVKTGRIDEAVAGFKAAAARDEANQAMQLAFAEFLASVGKGKEATDWLADLIQRFPSKSVYDVALAGLQRGQGQADASEAVLTKALDRVEAGADRVPIQVALAKLKREKGDDLQAETQLSAALKTEPTNVAALMARAGLNLDNGRVDAAITDLEAVTRTHPVYTQAFEMLAQAYLRVGRSTLAADAMRRAAATAFDNEAEQIKLVGFLEAAGDHRGARDLVNRLTLQRPNSPGVWVAAGQIAIAQKDAATLQRALAVLRSLPGQAVPLAGLTAQMKMTSGDSAGAAGDYLKALQAAPDVDPKVVLGYALASHAAGNDAGAAGVLAQRAPALKGEAGLQAWLMAMRLYASAGKADEAERMFQQAVAAAPKEIELYKSYAGLLVARQAFDAALAVVDRGLGAGLPKADLLVVKGWIEQQAGNAAAAKATYKEVLAINPLSAEALNNYANLIVDEQPRDMAAIKQVRDQMEGLVSSDDPQVVDTLAWLDYRLERFGEAKLLLTRIDAAKSQDPQIRFHLAAVLLASGDKPGGEALLETVKGLTFSGSDEARSLSAT